MNKLPSEQEVESAHILCPAPHHSATSAFLVFYGCCIGTCVTPAEVTSGQIAVEASRLREDNKRLQLVLDAKNRELSSVRQGKKQMHG